MAPSSILSVGPQTLARLALLALAGCGAPIYQATNGAVYEGPPDPAYVAAMASAAHDLACDTSIVIISRDRFQMSPQAFTLVPTVLEGCGRRAVYQVVHLEDSSRDVAGRFILFSLGPATGNP